MVPCEAKFCYWFILIDLNIFKIYFISDLIYIQDFVLLLVYSISSRGNLWTVFSAWVWSTYVNTSKIDLIYIVFHTFSTSF